MAALLSILAFTAFQSDAYAQARRGESRSSVSQERKAVATRQSPQSAKPSTQKKTSTVTKPINQSRPSAPTRQTATRSTTTRPSTATRPSNNSSAVNVDKNDRKPSTTVKRPTATRPATANKPATANRPVTVNRKPSVADKPAVVRPTTTVRDRPGNRNDRPADKKPSVRPDNKQPDRDRPERPPQVRPDRRPDVHRVHPRDRGFMEYNHPSHFWGHNHCFGHRVRVIPSHARRHIHFGVTYYCYNDIWYRPYAGYYVVCRPPFGTVLAAEIIADMAWSAVRLSYYYTVANTYSKINENNRYIAEQNAIIAQNNATIAAQNQAIAMNQQLASEAYKLANELGLVQSYAAAGSEYFYQDGVFYAKDANGEYKVIVPPAGAMVDSLPEDYDIVVLNGDEYYKVDDTVYKVTISEGKPYFEVLGQLYN